MKKAFLIGDRIYLRPFERTDLEGPYQDWINDPDVNHFLAAGAYPLSNDDLVAYYESNLKSDKQIFFAVVEKDTGKHIGSARIYNINWIYRKACRGIMIGDKTTWKKGYGLEVINLISAYAFNTLNLNKLISMTVEDNIGVRKVNERAGYKQEGLIRSEFYRDGKYYDLLYWGLLRSDYLAMKKEG